MERFREGLKRRLVGYIGSTVAALCVIIVSYTRYRTSETAGHVESFMSGFQVGLFAAGMLIALLNIYGCIKALKSEQACRKLYIKENDERTKSIWSKSVSMGFLVTMGTILVVTIVVGFYNVTVFVTLLSVLLFMAVVTVIFKVIYFNIM